LPHAWFARYAPIYEVLRSPDRLGVAGLMGLTLLIGTAFAESARSLIRVRRAAVRAALTAALAGLVSIGLYLRYAEAGPDWLGFDPTAPLPRAYPLSPPALLSPVLAEPVAARPGPLLELPIGPGVNPHAEAMYRSIFHRRPLLNGYDGYWPAQFPSRMQLACGLPDPGALRELRRRTGVETILVHLAVLDDAAGAALPYGCPHDMPRRTAWLEAASGPRSDLRLLARDADDLLFATDPAGTDIGEGDVHPGF
jgi:hypothetical protein